MPRERIAAIAVGLGLVLLVIAESPRFKSDPVPSFHYETVFMGFGGSCAANGSNPYLVGTGTLMGALGGAYLFTRRIR